MSFQGRITRENENSESEDPPHSNLKLTRDMAGCREVPATQFGSPTEKCIARYKAACAQKVWRGRDSAGEK
jgi:hypothetical protein